jgi:hypothetical protein
MMAAAPGGRHGTRERHTGRAALARAQPPRDQLLVGELQRRRQAHEFYTPDGLLVFGDNQFLGQQNIRAFYTWRQRRGVLTFRPLICNLLVVSSDECRASHTAMLSLYYKVRDRPPIRGTNPPSLIADIKADCVRGDDGVWRYQSHSVLPIFVGSDIPLALSVDTQILADIKRSPAAQTL